MNVINLAAVAALAGNEKPWVNDPFEAVVKNARAGSPPGDGKKAKPSKCVLVDPKDPNSILAASWFGGNFTRYEDKIVRISGNGTKVSEYNGKPEVSVGKDATVMDLGASPAQMGTPPSTSQSGNTPLPNTGRDTAPVDPVTYFHREMAKQSLGYLHCLQYARAIQAKDGKPLPPEQFQSAVSCLFIEGNKRGLFTKVPKLRTVDASGVPMPYTPPEPEPAAVKAEEERKAKEAEAKRKAKEAEEAAAKAREAAEQHPRTFPQENLDEDVPF